MPGHPDVISEPPPANAEPKHKIKNPAYTHPRTAPEIDLVDWESGTVIEIKSRANAKDGLAEAKAYAQEMNKYEPLPPAKDGSPRPWKAKCITYDYGAVLRFLLRIGYLK
jgi:hypothetical protein